jgi:hypothetical protein
MKPVVALAVVLVGSLVLAGCQSKRDICAEYTAINPEGWHEPEVTWKYFTRLGIKGNTKDPRFAERAIDAYCSFYK